MASTIADTVDAVRSLRSPVARSCHVGNNTSNVWGWLALGSNVRIVQYDHTLYGLDENCIPWVVLGDAGRAEASFAPDGTSREADTGRHVNELIADVDLKYTSHLNYGLFASYCGEDLILHHVRIARQLCHQANGSAPSFDSHEIVGNKTLFADVIRSLAKTDDLSLLFDRWVRTTRKRHVIMRRLRTIGRSNAIIEATDIDDTLVFRGTVQELIDVLYESLGAVAERLATGAALPRLNYPWFTLPFAYLANSLKEYATDPGQHVFWHAAGSASQYYINDPAMQSAFDILIRRLARDGFLPEDARLHMIPTFCCQLFSTTDAGRASLDSLLDAWRHYLSGRRASIAPFLEGLATTTDAFAVADEHIRQLPGDAANRLRESLQRFNDQDLNTLPVAHVVGRRHPNYNKYGVAQHHLLGCAFHFPSTLAALTWAEAELLVKTLAHLTLDRRS